MSELLRRVLATAATAPSRPAVVEAGRITSYAQLAAESERLAQQLRELGVEAGHRVAAVLPPGADLLTVALAAFALRAAYVPIDPVLPGPRIEQILAVSSPQVIVDRDGPLASGRPGTAPTPFDVAYVVSTSGSTGPPKAVQIEHRNLLNSLTALDRCAPVEGPYTGSWWASPTFDVSLWECWSPLLSGGTVAVVPAGARLDAERFGAFLDAADVHSVYAPPGLLQGLREYLAADPTRCSQLSRLLVGVEPIPLGLLQDLQAERTGLRVVNAYGPAEATIYCTLYPVPPAGGERAARTPIGTAVPGNTLYVQDEQGRLHTSGAGELVVAGANVGRGYLDGDPAGRFLADVEGERAYRTGDLVRFLPDGNLLFEGRRDGQLKIRGSRIEAGEVEAAIRASAPVREVVADLRENSVLAAYIVPEPGGSIDAQELRRALLGTLPPAAVPTIVLTLEDLPQTANGKIDRAALARLPAPTSASASIRTDESWSLVREAVREATGSPPSPDWSFLESGGTSLSAVRMAVALRTYGAQELTPFEILAATTLGELADSLKPSAPTGIDHRHEGRLSGPLTPAQLGIWMHDQLDPDSARYVESYCVEISWAVVTEGPHEPGVDEERLRATVAAAAAAHPAFTAVIRDDGESVTMQLLAHQPFLEVIRPGDRAAALRLAAELARTPIDLADGPLMRAQWAPFAPGRGLLTFVWHHAVVDGWSLRLFLADLGRVYAEPGRPLARAEGTICDANVRAIEHAASPGLRSETEVTVSRLLADFPAGTSLTWSREGGPGSAGHSRTVLSEHLSSAVRAAAIAHGTSPFVELLAAYEYALASALDLPRFVVGCADGRARAAREWNVAGYMVDTRLVVGASVRGRAVGEFLREASARAAEVLSRPVLAPLAAVIPALRRERPVPAAFPSFYFSADEENVLTLPGAECRIVDLPAATPKFAVTLEVKPIGSRFVLRLEWDRGLVNDAEADALGQALERAVAALDAP
ncbi:AMP-binding protein [Kineosporia rhizophila]|uniref:amino acid adenylation domain-containing protein n=1 Tax=Kineosporia rhizophila TaxID=84633 RepID=UPI001E5F5856|nr:AMP-binding protein [Kineosporia rhizophila]MCE0539747.1 AMP-binding protein [Kineosporia rhizophila]